MYYISNERLVNIIADGKTYAIITHKRPDGDAISSSLAMFWYLLDIGKKEKDIDVIVPAFSDDFSFIPGTNYFKQSRTQDKYDIAIILDCAAEHLLEGYELVKDAKSVIVFDHHDETSIPFDYCIFDTVTPSCTSILYETFKCKDKNFLDCVAIGLMSDTANMTLNVTDVARRVMKSLKEESVDLDAVSASLNAHSSRTMNLVQLAIERGCYHVNSIFCSFILQKDLKDYEKDLTRVNHKSIIAELMNSVEHSSLILLIENDKGEFKGSLRTSDSSVDLNSICSSLVSERKILKGGGHSYSSGCTIKISYNDVQECGYENYIQSIFKMFADEINKR